MIRCDFFFPHHLFSEGVLILAEGMRSVQQDGEGTIQTEIFAMVDSAKSCEMLQTDLYMQDN